MSILALRAYAKTLSDIEIIPVGIFFGVSVIWPNVLPAALICAAFFWIVRWAAYGSFSVRTPGDWGIIILIIMVPITLWVTAVPEKTHLQVLRLISGIGLYYAIANWCNSLKRLRMTLPVYALSGLGLALMAAINVQWAIGKLAFVPASLFQQFPAQFTDTIHPNVLAGSLILLLPIILAELLFAWRELGRFERTVNLVGLLAMLTVILMTLSRGAWMALGVVVVLMPILRWRRGWIGLALISSLFIGLSLWSSPMTILEALASSGTIGGIEGRLEIWSRAMYMIEDFPFTGIGMGSFNEAADTLYPFLTYAPGTVAHAHNLFLQIAVDLGVPGLIGWLMVFGSVIQCSWKLYRSGKTAKMGLAAGLGAGLFCSQLGLAAHGMTDSVTWGMVRPAPFVWAVWGLAAAAWIVFTKNFEAQQQPE